MKKILTVLLALSVVFTYSFATVGTAFAATPLTEAEYDQLVEQAAAQVEATTNTAYTEAVKVLPDHDVDSITGIGAEYWKANASVYGNKLSDMIDKKEAEIKQLFNSHQTDVENATLDTLVKLQKAVTMLVAQLLKLQLFQPALLISQQPSKMIQTYSLL